jgi:glycosyltransferase involved in cell wall biosynthesis
LWGPFVRRAAGAVLALDEAARQTALDRGFPASRVALVPHGVDVERYRPGLASAELARHRIHGRVLTYAGALECRAELELLLAAFARTLGQRDDWSLVFAGNDPSPRLRASAQRLGIGARTYFFAVDDQALPALLASSTLYAQPFVEGASGALSLARAMACGATVLAADNAETRAWIDPGDSGLLAPPNDLEAWTNLLRRAASSPETRRRTSLAARRAAEQRWSWPVVAAAFERTIAAATAPAPGAPPLSLDSAEPTP